MGVYVILPESLLTAKMQDTIVIDDEEASSDTDSVDLLVQRSPRLLNRHDVATPADEQDEEGSSSENDEIDADYFSVTEYQMSLNDINEVRSPISSKPRRKRRFEMNDSFGLLDIEDVSSEESGDSSDDDTIEFP